MKFFLAVFILFSSLYAEKDLYWEDIAADELCSCLSSRRGYDDLAVDNCIVRLTENKMYSKLNLGKILQLMQPKCPRQVEKLEVYLSSEVFESLLKTAD